MRCIYLRCKPSSTERPEVSELSEWQVPSHRRWNHDLWLQLNIGWWRLQVPAGSGLQSDQSRLGGFRGLASLLSFLLQILEVWDTENTVKWCRSNWWVWQIVCMSMKDKMEVVRRSSQCLSIQQPDLQSRPLQSSLIKVQDCAVSDSRSKQKLCPFSVDLFTVRCDLCLCVLLDLFKPEMWQKKETAWTWLEGAANMTTIIYDIYAQSVDASLEFEIFRHLGLKCKVTGPHSELSCGSLTAKQEKTDSISPVFRAQQVSNFGSILSLRRWYLSMWLSAGQRQ